MNRDRAIGLVTIAAGLPPLLMGLAFAFFFGAGIMAPVTLTYAVPGGFAIAGGSLLCIGRGPRYGLSIIAWAAIFVAAADGIRLWLMMAPGSVFSLEIIAVEATYAATAVIFLTLLVHRRAAENRSVDAV